MHYWADCEEIPHSRLELWHDRYGVRDMEPDKWKPYWERVGKYINTNLVPESITNRNNQLGTVEMFKYETEDLHIPHDILDVVHGGMFDVVNVPGGTAGVVKLPDIAIAGKTGTAQVGGGKLAHSWFICYAPFDHPKIAMCVLVENTGSGARFAGPIARKLVHYYFTRQKEVGDDLSEASQEASVANGLRSVSGGDSNAHRPAAVQRGGAR